MNVPVILDGSPPYPAGRTNISSLNQHLRKGEVRVLAEVLGNGGFSTVRTGFFRAPPKQPVAFNVAVKQVTLSQNVSLKAKKQDIPVLSGREAKSVEVNTAEQTNDKECADDKRIPQEMKLEVVTAERAILVALQPCKYVVRYFGHVMSAGEFWFVLEACIAVRLENLLLGGLSNHQVPTVAFYLMCPIIEAVAYMHGKGIIHRDIKPSNVLLSPEGVPKLCDFGVSIDQKQTKCEMLNIKDHGFVGTLPFVAPEVMLEQPYGPKVDCWALGLTLSKLHLGHRFAFCGGFDTEYGVFKRWEKASDGRKAEIQKGIIIRVINGDEYQFFPPAVLHNYSEVLKQTVVFDVKRRLTSEQLLCFPIIGSCLAFWEGETEAIPEKLLSDLKKARKLLHKLVKKTLKKKWLIPEKNKSI